LWTLTKLKNASQRGYNYSVFTEYICIICALVEEIVNYPSISATHRIRTAAAAESRPRGGGECAEKPEVWKIGWKFNRFTLVEEIVNYPSISATHRIRTASAAERWPRVGGECAEKPKVWKIGWKFDRFALAEGIVNYPSISATHRIRTASAAERWPKWGCCNRRLLALADDGWKFIFKDNHLTKTKICDSKQHPHADKSSEAPHADRIPYTRKRKSGWKSTASFFVVDRGFEPLCPAW